VHAPVASSDSGYAYLDNAAATPMHPEAVEAMLPYLTAVFANASGAHRASRRARRALDDARDELASLLGCAPGELVFTGGGTEADNLAVLGVHAGRPGPVVVSAVEHRAVLEPSRRVGASIAPVTSQGVVDLAILESMLTRDVTLVSVMLVNSETGVIQPVREVASAVARIAPSALVHSDAAQALSWLDVAPMLTGCDLATISAHKFGGPKGVAALVVRERAAAVLQPLLHGGGQERERRPGTENVAGIVAMAVAARCAVRDREQMVKRVTALRDRLADGLMALGVIEPAPRSIRIAGNCHLRFPGVAAEELLVLLDRRGVAASMGSACASGAREPSHVLSAMGWDRSAAREAVRFSLGATTTQAEIDHARAAVIEAVEQLGHSSTPRATG